MSVLRVVSSHQHTEIQQNTKIQQNTDFLFLCENNMIDLWKAASMAIILCLAQFDSVFNLAPGTVITIVTYLDASYSRAVGEVNRAFKGDAESRVPLCSQSPANIVLLYSFVWTLNANIWCAVDYLNTHASVTPKIKTLCYRRSPIEKRDRKADNSYISQYLAHKYQGDNRQHISAISFTFSFELVDILLWLVDRILGNWLPETSCSLRMQASGFIVVSMDPSASCSIELINLESGPLLFERVVEIWKLYSSLVTILQVLFCARGILREYRDISEEQSNLVGLRKNTYSSTEDDI